MHLVKFLRIPFFHRTPLVAASEISPKIFRSTPCKDESLLGKKHGELFKNIFYRYVKIWLTIFLKILPRVKFRLAQFLKCIIIYL